MGTPIYVFGARGRRPQIIAHHLILTGYGHWLANDLRGSGSTESRDPKFEPLGPIHQGRKQIQPSRNEVREFYVKAEPLLNFDRLWFDESRRRILASAFAEVVKNVGYTVYACAICSNHAHLLVRRHRHTAEVIWRAFAERTAGALRCAGDINAPSGLVESNVFGVLHELRGGAVENQLCGTESWEIRVGGAEV